MMLVSPRSGSVQPLPQTDRLRRWRDSGVGLGRSLGHKKGNTVSVINFKEIAQANTGSGEQDSFELFSRDFLKYFGYEVVSDPARGADGGVDLVVKECRKGVGGETEIRWLVSCKHYAHSGKSVSPQDEINIRDRVDANKCHGFIGFYSTLASTGLMSNLEGTRDKLEFQIFDNKKIEESLLHSSSGIKLSERYFPDSIAKWSRENPKPAKLFVEEPSLKCKYCDKELLTSDAKGIIVIWEHRRQDYKKENQRYEEIYWCCKGNCDSSLAAPRRSKPWIDGWEDIPDVMMPTIFIKWVMTILNEQRDGTEYSDEAFDQLKEFLLNVFPHVSRHLTENEKENIKTLGMIPSYLGGLGYEA